MEASVSEQKAVALVGIYGGKLGFLGLSFGEDTGGWARSPMSAEPRTLHRAFSIHKEWWAQNLTPFKK
jgi:hypothetical protein